MSTETTTMRMLVHFRIPVIIALLTLAGALRGQDIDTLKTWTVEQFAQKLTDQMKSRVPLQADQVDPVHKINLKFAGQVLPVLNGPDDQKKKIARVKEFDTQRAGELEIFLGAEQMRQVRQIQTENRRKMKQTYTAKHL